MIAENSGGAFCSRLSLDAQEPAFATASRVDVWFLLQYSYPWATEALPAARLPEPLNRRLDDLCRLARHSKLLLIKQSPRIETPLSFYVAINDVQAPKMYRFELDSYDALLDLDLEGLLAGRGDYEPLPDGTALYLVCTHGTHDRCCAKFGLPIYRELAHGVGEAAWQCSHVGGDRFAANLLCFPHGLYYGHVERNEVGAIAEAYRRRRLYLPKFRGRSCYSMPFQAAEFFLRLQTGEPALPGFRPLGARPSGPDRWQIRFASIAGVETYRLEVERSMSVVANHLSCRGTSKSGAPQYRLLDYALE